MKKISIKKLVLSIVVFIIVVVIIILGRRFIILNSLRNKAENHKSSNNYHLEVISNDNTAVKQMDIYYKDGKVLTKIVSEREDENEKVESEIIFVNGKAYQKTKKISKEDSNNIKEERTIGNISTPGDTLEPFNFLETDSTFDFIKNIFTSHIALNEDAYMIEGYKGSKDKIQPNKMDVDSNTGLVKRVYETDTKYNWSFNTVTDNDVKEPNELDYISKQE